MITTSKWLGLLAAAFVAGAFIASPAPQAIAAVIATDVICNGCVGTSDLANNAVTSAKIKDGEVKTADLGSNSVTAGKIKDGEVKGPELAGNAVTSLKINDDTIMPADIATPEFMKRITLLPGAPGWNPNNVTTTFLISDADASGDQSVIIVNTDAGNNPVCSVDDVFPDTNSFRVNCNVGVASNAELHYMIIKLNGLVVKSSAASASEDR